MATPPTPQTPPEWYDPEYPPLKGSVGQAAVKGQLVSYPMVVRGNIDPPVIGQQVSLVSFMFFKEPQVEPKSGKPLYGFFKIRGNHADMDLAKKNAAGIIREHDSKYRIRHGPVGYWLPITEADGPGTDMLDVRMNDEEVHLRDQMAKEKQHDEARVMRELEDRKEQLKKDIYDDKSSLDYYTMKRVTDLRLQENLDIEARKFEDIKEKLATVRKELKGLEAANAQYRDLWVDNYNEGRKKSGISAYVPSEKYTALYEEAIKNVPNVVSP